MDDDDNTDDCDMRDDAAAGVVPPTESAFGRVENGMLSIAGDLFLVFLKMREGMGQLRLNQAFRVVVSSNGDQIGLRTS